MRILRACGQIAKQAAASHSPYESRTSLNADAIKVGSGAYLGPGFSCDGAVSRRDAIITGQLSFRAATISGKDTSSWSS